jgi:hypothetical protein
MKFAASVIALSAGASIANAQIGFVDFNGVETGLVGYTNAIYSYTGPGLGTNATLLDQGLGNANSSWSPGDAFWPMTRANLAPNGIGMPFGISDDSVAPAAGNTLFETDTQGFAGQAFDNNGFFGVIDTENSSNSGPTVATFDFDITGASNLGFQVDLVAMGDFEASGDFIRFEYSIDGGSFTTLLESTIDESLTQTYTMDNPANNPVMIDDPMVVAGVLLNDEYQTFSAAIAGSGSTLSIRFTAQLDGGSEGFGFDNLTIVPAPGAAALLALGGLVASRRRR